MTRTRPSSPAPTSRSSGLEAVAARSLSRRTLLAGGLAGGLAASLAACGSPAGATPTAIRYWNLFSGADGARMETMLSSVRETTGIGVDATVLAWGTPYYTKLSMSAAGGRSPEMAIVHLSRLAGYAPLGFLDPFDLALLAEFGVEESSFPESVVERARYDGGLYAVPLDTHPFVVMYDTEVAEQARLLDGDGKLLPLETPEAFLEAGRALQSVTGELGIAYGFQGDPAQAWRLFYSLYPQLAGEIDLSGSTTGIDRDAAVQSVDLIKQMLDGTIADPNADYQSALATFNAGRAGMILTGEWELPAFLEAGIPLGAAPFPAVFGTPSAYADSHAFVLPHQDDPDPEVRRATHEAVAQVLKQSFTWAEAGHVPAYAEIADSPEYAQLTPQSDYAAAADVAVFDPPAWFTGAGSNFQTQVGQALATTLSGSATPAEAVEDMVARIDTILATPDPGGESA